MTNFIELQYADDLENYTDQVVFLGDITQDNIFHPYNVNQINNLLKIIERGTIQENILPFLESVGYHIEALAELYNTCVVGDDPDDFDDFDDFEANNIGNTISAAAYDTSAFIADMFYYIECEQHMEMCSLTEKFINYLGLQTFTAGYSPWSRVVTFKDHDQEFYSDLYNGWNFYNLIEVDQYGDIIDIVGGYYIQTDQELRDAVKDCFGVDSFKLVDNEPGSNFSIEKAETTTTYK